GASSFTATVSVGSASSLSDLQSKYDKLEKELAALKNQYNNAQNTIKDKQKYVEYLNNQIDLIDEQLYLLEDQLRNVAVEIKTLELSIDTINEKVTTLQMQITDNEAEIEQKKADIEELYELFKERVRSMYMQGQVSDIQILLTSGSFSQYLTMSGYMTMIARHDSEMLDRLTEEINELNILESRLEIEKGQVDEAQAKLVSEKEALEAQKIADEELKIALEAKTIDLEKQKEDAKKTILDLTNGLGTSMGEISATQKELEALEEEIKQQIEAGKDLEGDTSGPSGTVYPSGGKEFMWPVPGYYNSVSSHFGPRWGRTHGGIDIAGYNIYGKDIVAAKAGTIITVTYNWSLGNYVMINHGDGYVTLYAHMSAFVSTTQVGRYVKQGEVIGKIGSTGDSTGPHLHFEIRINGTKVDPYPYII
ncbi:MAG: peptidoglycan DD-metalloendopeptidase family protein, partial [Clostridia bacterium]|nr:peptidoglycan DD-metalloendopeptidase family protein [Clostridia bacterium]